jgi:hypothetical protein
MDHVRSRDQILRALREELVGPSPQGSPVDCSGDVSFDSAAEGKLPRRQSGSGEEILTRDSPTQRYGVGVLYPQGVLLGGATIAGSDDDPADRQPADDGDTRVMDALTGRELASADVTPEGLDSASALGEPPEGDDLDISSANTYRPSSMAVSFLAEFPDDAQLEVDASGGRYHRKKVHIEGKERVWWLRRPFRLTMSGGVALVCPDRTGLVHLLPRGVESAEGASIDVEVHSRPYSGSRAGRYRLLTVCLVNRASAEGGSVDELSLFQAHMKVRVSSSQGAIHILPYPRQQGLELDEEEQSLDLLYRDAETFAVGHGCAAEWVASEVSGRAAEVSAECLPWFETASITPAITREDGTDVAVSMGALAGLVPGDDGFGSMAEVVALYEEWIGRRRLDARKLDARFRQAAECHLQQCERCAQRMRDGLQYLRSNAAARRAFCLANHALLLQQIAGARKVRHARYDEQTERLCFSEPYLDPVAAPLPLGKGNWRPFQIAFLLMAVRSTAEPEDTDRQAVELIWFPTGGGKTEAYLALASFAMFLRRIKKADDVGVTALMRYTLRLLTAQQFMRASGLMCAMEYIRRQYGSELGAAPFTIGIWLGSSTTPNTREEAKQALGELKRGGGNKFVLGRCPWCAAQLGRCGVQPTHTGRRRRRRGSAEARVVGYVLDRGTVVFRCPDSECRFHAELPVYVTDEDIYDVRPSLVIGTVDKFAMLAWRPAARVLFGIGPDGDRMYSPPGLIIQDELHLISGPLGSMVGLYETVIDELCTHSDAKGPTIAPKIVCSTATIRRYAEQVRALYGREATALFPPPGVSADDSFFARYARGPDGSLEHGRLYVGVHAPGLGSLQTAQVRSFASLLQSPVPLTPEERDPWWTLVIFFNSLRELGTTLSLLQSDIPDRLKSVRLRRGLGFGDVRRHFNVLELTGRIDSDKVPKAISALEVACGESGFPVDVCLASSIMEVGIDIDRLSLMALVGQPKTTSQYIQVTGRVGRKWHDRPGLVVTIYSASKPRDRSHFEKFRSYHERLYAQVEPTSVTPFSPPALDRALHAVMVAYVRQAGDGDAARSPYPLPVALLEALRDVLLRRIERIAPGELASFRRVFGRRLAQWRAWGRSRWTGTVSGGDVPMLREAGSYASPRLAAISWPMPRSMRDVDAECQAEVTTLYAERGVADAEGAH